MFSINDSINIKITDALKLSNKALVAFVNKKTMKVWISYTNSMLASLERNTTLLKQGMHSISEMNADINDLEVVLLEEHGSMRYLKYRMKHYYDQYINSGYSLYKKELFVHYEFKVKIFKGEAKVKLYLQGKNRGNSLLVGEFKNMADCTSYMEKGIASCLKEILD